ncbi:MAG: tetratricopeptide repeat protein [Gemmatimonadaceae bacterium]
MNERARWLTMLAVAGLALAASANSIGNGFAYDDVALILTDARVHSWSGWTRDFAQTYWPEGGDGYRPLTILAWRAQWAAGGGSPATFHAVNVLLHVATAVAVLWLAGAILPLGAAALAGALYAVHPVHVEAIANVVGQSELFVALLAVVAVGLYVHARLRGAVSARRWSVIATLYGFACFFKEHAIVLPLLLVVAESTVVTDAAPLGGRLRRMRVPLLVLCLIAVGYLWARSRVFADGLAGFRPFVVFDALHLSTADRVLTMIGAATEWLRLLLWPARLVTQYAPTDIEVAQGPGISQLPGLLVLAGTVGLMIACWRKRPVVSFGIAWLIITLLPTSNFLVAAGFIIAERTLLLPSVGAMIALASGLWLVAERVQLRSPVTRTAAGFALAVVLGLGIVRSVTRNRVWHDDDRLWRQGVLDAPDSYLAHFRLGLHLLSHNQERDGEAHYRRAIDLFPHDPIVAYSLAEQLRAAGKCDAALPIYGWIFSAWPDSRRGHLGYAVCLIGKGRFDEAREQALVWIRRGGRVAVARQVLAAAKTGRDSATAHRRGTQE